MSSSVKVNNALQFRNRALFNKLPASDKYTTDPIRADKFPVANKVVQDFWNYIDAPPTAWGKQLQFTIPRSDGMLYEMYLEIMLPSDAVTYVALPAIAAIQQYEFLVGNSLINCSGRAMFEGRRLFMNTETRSQYIALAGGDGGTDIPSTSVFSLLDWPGCMWSDINAWSHDEAWGVPFPLNKCNADAQVRIQLNSAANMVTSGTLASNASFRLWYQSVGTSNVDDDLVNNGQDGGIIIPGYRIIENTSGQSYTLSTTTSVPVDITPSIDDGELLFLLVSANTAAELSTNKKYFAGALQKELKLVVNGNNFYQHYSTQDGIMRGFNTKGVITDTVASGYSIVTYPIECSTNGFQVFGSEWSGLNLFRNNPRITVTMDSVSGAGNVFVASVTRCFYIISPQGSVNYFMNV